MSVWTRARFDLRVPMLIVWGVLIGAVLEEVVGVDSGVAIMLGVVEAGMACYARREGL